MKNKGRGNKEMKQVMTLRDHHALHGSHMKGAEDLGISTNNYALWLCGKFKPCWKSIRVLAAKGISLSGFPD